MDGVLVDFVGGARKFYNLPDVYADPKNYGVWDFISLLGMDEKEFWKPLGAEFWANLEPTPDCQEILEIVENYFGKENVCLLTSPAPNDECPTGKMRYIRKNLPDYSRRYLMGPAKEFCANKKHWLIDDRDSNVDSFHGGQVCLVPRPWNRNHREQTLPYLRQMFRIPRSPSELARWEN